ncbi:hypothetical protein ACQJBY_034874 [Aegilops geniculata]
MWRVCGHHADAEKEVQVAGALEVRWLQGRSRRIGSSAPPGCLRHQQCGQGRLFLLPCSAPPPTLNLRSEYCSSLALVWSELQSFHPLNVDSVKDLLEKLFRQDSLYNVVIIVLWNIWKRKNSKVSRDVFEELHITASKIADD